jgi:hypothetical protein
VVGLLQVRIAAEDELLEPVVVVLGDPVGDLLVGAPQLAGRRPRFGASVPRRGLYVLESELEGFGARARAWATAR